MNIPSMPSERQNPVLTETVIKPITAVLAMVNFKRMSTNHTVHPERARRREKSCERQQEQRDHHNRHADEPIAR